VADVLARPVNHLAPSGTSQPLDHVVLGPGGNSFNTAIALTRLGVSVRVAAAIGNDRFGQYIRDRVRAEGIDDAGLVILPGAKTSTSIVLPRDFSPPFAEAKLSPSPRAMPTPPEGSPRSVWVEPIRPPHSRNSRIFCANIPLPDDLTETGPTLG
jgi:hypothetical protein